MIRHPFMPVCRNTVNNGIGLQYSLKEDKIFPFFTYSRKRINYHRTIPPVFYVKSRPDNQPTKQKQLVDSLTFTALDYCSLDRCTTALEKIQHYLFLK